eukprot:356647-Chlamydomonas_euryale.AAC.1
MTAWSVSTATHSRGTLLGAQPVAGLVWAREPLRTTCEVWWTSQGCPGLDEVESRLAALRC